MHAASYIFIDNEVLPEAAARLPIKLSGLETGAGVFTVMRLQDGKIESLDAHIERLKRHATAHGLAIPEIKNEFFYSLVEMNQAHKGTFRLKALIIPTRLDPYSWGKTSLVIYLDPYVSRHPEELLLDLYASDPSPMTARIKTLSRLERRMLWQKAHTDGYNEVLMTTTQGVLLEALWSNVFWVHDKTLFTPDPSLPYMVGITLQNLERAVQTQSLSLQHVTCRLDDIPQEAHLFLSNALIHILPVVQVQDRRFNRDKALEERLKHVLLSEITCQG